MKTLYMLKGLPASGKSTYAKTTVEKFQAGAYKRISKDDLRLMLDNSRWSDANEKFILKVRDMLIVEALREGKHVLVDDTNLAPKHEKTLREIAKANGAAFEIVDFTYVAVDECIKRDAQRSNSVGKKVIVDMYEKYLKPKPTEPPPYDPNKRQCVIVDVDGTVAKMNGRSPFEWNKVGTDIPNEPILKLVQLLWEGPGHGIECEVVFVSGRDECCRKETQTWLDDHFGFYYSLYMRPAGDTRKDAIVKKEIYEKEIKPNYNVWLVLDDRNQTVEAWRSLGLTCLQVADGNF